MIDRRPKANGATRPANPGGSLGPALVGDAPIKLLPLIASYREAPRSQGSIRGVKLR
jgi:hypothetical protein